MDKYIFSIMLSNPIMIIGPSAAIPFIFMMMFLLFIPLFLIIFIFWIWMLVDCISSDMKPEEKMIWIIVILFLHFIGALLYLIIGRSGKHIVSKTGTKKLYRPRKGRMIAGVCLGFAEYYGVDVTMVRLIWALLTLFSGIWLGIIAYIIAIIIIPEKRITHHHR